jgi:molybdopterin converting factor small subunit
MNIQVRLFGEVAKEVGIKPVAPYGVVSSTFELELEDDSSMLALIQKLQKNSGSSCGGYLGRFKVSGADLTIMVNGKNIALLDGVNTKLNDNDYVVIMPFAVGG